MSSFVKINFTLECLSFPVGEIVKMFVWLDKPVKDELEYLNDNLDIIQESVPDKLKIHSMKILYKTYSSRIPDDEQIGEFLFLSQSPATLNDAVKEEKEKLITDIKRLDYPNIDDIDLKKLTNNVKVELFKRDFKLSDDMYDFYAKNKEFIQAKDVRSFCEEYGIKDKYILKKQQIRKKLQSEII